MTNNIEATTETASMTERQHVCYWLLYLLNLLLVPVISAGILVILIARHGLYRDTKNIILALIICAIALLIIPGLMWISLPKTGMFWVVFICYWVTAHGGCILLGVLGMLRRKN